MNVQSHGIVGNNRWTICRLGHVHWGFAGGAGLLLRYRPPDDEPSYLLQQRAGSADFPGTWGIPGGAIQHGESPEAAAEREAQEELGPLGPFRITGVDVVDCGGGWLFHTVTADADSPFPVYCVRETTATGWFTRGDMASLPIHPGFQTWLDKEDHSWR